jgi:hypothetical protein
MPASVLCSALTSLRRCSRLDLFGGDRAVLERAAKARCISVAGLAGELAEACRSTGARRRRRLRQAQEHVAG